MTQAETLQVLKNLVGRMFGVDPGSLTGATEADDVDGWDSLAHSALLIRIRKAFDVDLDTDAANSARSLAELAQVITAAHP